MRVGSTVRRATAGDADEVVDVLERALASDPFVAWLTRAQPRAMRSYLRLMVKKIALAKGVVHVALVDGAIASAALWAPPHTFELTAGESLRFLPTMVGVIGALRFSRVAASLGEVERARPLEPRWLLTLLGTIPEHRGEGLATSVLAPALARCDSERTVAVCETSQPRNLRFYAHHGFVVTSERTLDPSGPPSWTLVREPQRTLR